MVCADPCVVQVKLGDTSLCVVIGARIAFTILMCGATLGLGHKVADSHNAYTHSVEIYVDFIKFIASLY